MADTGNLPAQRKSITLAMADRYGMDASAFEQTVRATCSPKNQTLTKEQFAAAMVVAHEYRLNPLTREIFFFPSQNGIVPVVSIDGWARIINENPAMNGMRFEDHREDGKLVSITCHLYRKDREHPISVPEYMEECARPTEPWKKWPNRMLRHKALIQCARVAFGFAGIYDQDEAERIIEAEATEVESEPGIFEMNSSQAKRAGIDKWITETLLGAQTPADIDNMFEDARWKCVPPSWRKNYAEMIEYHKARVSAPADYNPLSIVLKAIEKADSGEALLAINDMEEYAELREDARAEADAATVTRARELADD